MKTSIKGRYLVILIVIVLANIGDCFHRKKERLARKEKKRLERLVLKAKRENELLQQFNITQVNDELEQKILEEEELLKRALKQTDLSLSMQGDQGVPGLAGIRGPPGPEGRPVSEIECTANLCYLLSIVKTIQFNIWVY